MENSVCNVCFQEQLGQEAEFPQQVLPDGKVNVDGFLFVFDVSFVPRRCLEKVSDSATRELR